MVYFNQDRDRNEERSDASDDTDDARGHQGMRETIEEEKALAMRAGTSNDGGGRCGF